MKIELHPIIDERERFFVPISEFSFAAYPVQINHGFRSLPDEAVPPHQPRNLRRNVWRRRFSHWLHRACGKQTPAPAAGNISPNQAVL
jgi:hypothetical protein